MKTMRKLAMLSLLVSAVFLLVSCGGDGGGRTLIIPSGSGSVTLDPVAKTITGSFTTTNVTNARLAHIHDGDLGQAPANNVVVGLVQSSPEIWSVPANTVLNDAQILRLRAGGYYVNVHTTLNPLGEIRGQLTVDSANANKFNATLDLAQEVPAPTLPVGSY